MAQLIDIALIDDPEFNSRVSADPEKLIDLAATIKAAKPRGLFNTGLNQPIGVEMRANGRYLLVWGSRRVQAFVKNDETLIPAEVREETDELTRIIDNGVENLQRENLTTFETARLCATCRAKGMKGKETAQKLRLSESHISNLAVCYEMLPDEIKKEWQKGHPAAEIRFLRDLLYREDDKGKKVGRAPEEQIALWKERVAALSAVEGDAEEEDEEEDDTDEGPEKDDKKSKPKSFTVTRDRYKAILAALRNSKSPQIATDVLRFAVGEIEKVRGLTIKEGAESKKEDKK